MKVGSTKGLGRPAVATAGIAIATAIAVLTGTGLIPSREASAQVAGAGIGSIERDVLSLVPNEGQKTADSIREPSGLGAVDAELSGTRKPTTIRRTIRAASTSQPAATPDGWRSARVSWYGPGFYGNTMAGGGTLQPDSMVVAHRTLPFGTMIEFSYNGRTCIAVVADRGPYVGGRVFDLGPGTAAALGFSGVGTVQYRFL